MTAPVIPIRRLARPFDWAVDDPSLKSDRPEPQPRANTQHPERSS